MYKQIILLLGLIICLSCQENHKDFQVEDSNMNDYALYDEKGNFHRFSYYNNSKALVLFVQGNGCPMVRNALNDFNKIMEEYKESGFTFFMINSNLQDSRTKIEKEAKDFNFKIPVLCDSSQIVADALDITITAQIIILHPTTRQILFRGPINDRLGYESQKSTTSNNYLRDALDAINNNIDIKKNSVATKGCKVTRLYHQENPNQLTYTADIAPILKNKCVKCHNPNGIAPWSMDDYATVNGWSAMMKQVLLSKRMPPWNIDTEIGEFRDPLNLEDSTLRKLIKWIDEGRKYGKGPDLLKEIKTKSIKWKAGVPDTIIQLKPEKIPATGIVDYRFQEFSLKLKKDTYLGAVEILPGNTKVVHHITLSLKQKPRMLAAFNRKEIKHIDNYFAFSASEDQITSFPEGSGYLLKKDQTIMVQIHYATTGKEEVDTTQIGLYYLDKKPEKQIHSIGTSNYTFTIPPFGKNIKVIATDTTNTAITIHFLTPHMHYRGKSISMKVKFPDGSTEKIISIADYNFNWQRFYKLKKPLSVPKGSVILVEGIFDNTYQNSFNPDPYQEIKFGRQSFDEMMIGFYNYTIN